MAIPPVIVIAEGTKIAAETIKAIKEYSIATEKENTERLKVRAALEARLKELELKSDLVKLAMKNLSSERLKLYDAFQLGLTISVQNGDTSMFEVVSKAMISVYDRAPKLNEIHVSTETTNKLSHDG
jgi:hypothetical protein